MRRNPRPDRSRFAAYALLAALPLLTQCAIPLAKRLAGETASATASSSVPPPPFELVLVPDPELQALIDPYPAWRGPSWLGGDVATSIRVGDDRWFWLFGDTLLGRVRIRCPGGEAYCDREVLDDGPWSSLIRNSGGVQWRDVRGVPTRVEKVWRTTVAGPAPLFADVAPGEFLWPLSGWRAGSTLLIAANVHTDASGLHPVGGVLIRVTNPDAPPDLWAHEVHALPNTRAGVAEPDPLTWTTAMVEDAGYLYLVGQRGVGFAARTVLSRLPVAGLDAADWTPRPQYLVDHAIGDRLAWSPTFVLEDLHEVPGLPGTSEASFERVPGLGWITFQIPPLGFQIRAYTAPSLLGPWTDRGVVYDVPAPWSLVTREDCHPPETGCGIEHYATYAVKSHPELAPHGGFALSFNVNVFFGSLEMAEREAETMHGFYVPQIVSGTPRR